MLVMMAGLPASGKSAVARPLAAALPGVILDKDRIRAALFPPEEIEYSTEQNDFCMDVALQVARYILSRNPARVVFLDGRPFSRRYQRAPVFRLAEELNQPLKIIECVCSEDTARQRLERAVSQAEHIAADRDYDLYMAVKAQFEPIEQSRLVVNTDNDLELCLQQCLDYLKD